MHIRREKIIALLLAFIMLFQISGITEIAAYAEGAEIEYEETEYGNNNETAVKTTEIMGEDPEKREEYIKHFRMEDGTFLAVVYNEPVHYEKDGKLKDIDNTLQSVEVKYSVPHNDAEVICELTASKGELINEEVFTVIGKNHEVPEPEDPEEAEESAEEAAVENAVPEEAESEETPDQPLDSDVMEDFEDLEENDAPFLDEGDFFNELSETDEAVLDYFSAPAKITTLASVTKLSSGHASYSFGDSEEEYYAEDAEDIYNEHDNNDAIINFEGDTEYSFDEGANKEDKYSEDATAEEEMPAEEEEKASADTIDINEFAYINTANDFEISLPVTMNGNNRVGVHNKGYSMYFRIEGTAEDDIGESNAEKRSFSLPNDEKMSRTYVDTRSGVSYKSLLPGIDVDYTLSGKTLKENIIIASREDMPEMFSFILSAGELTPELREDGSILVCSSEGETAFYLPAPCMFDSGMGYSDDIDVKIQELSNGDYRIIYIPNSEWLNDEEREWPVTVDPVVTTNQDINNIRDSWVCSGSPYSNFQNNMYLPVGYQPSFYSTHAFIKWSSIPTLKSTDNVLSAEMYLIGVGYLSYYTMVEAHAVTEYWASESVKWTNQPNYESKIVDIQEVGDYDSWYSWDVTEVVKRWYADDIDGLDHLANNGFALTSVMEDEGYCCYMYSSDNNDWARPCLYISYANTSGLESYWDYTSQSMGRAGTAYVNDYTGNLVLSRTDMAYSGVRMPAEITLNYNFSDRSTNIGYGNGWRLSYAQQISSANVGGTNYYKWIDGDGTVKYFYNSSGIWKDEAGQGYTLTINNSAPNGVKYVIKDKQDNALNFDTYGRLNGVIDGGSSSNTIKLTYQSNSSSDLKITSVTDGAGRVYSLSYTDGKLSSVQYRGTGSNAIETVNYTYSGSCPVTVTYADGKTAEYTWESNRMTSAKDIIQSDGYQDTLSIAYFVSSSNSSLPVRVKKLSYYSDNTLVTSAEFFYGHNYTKVTDNVGRWCVYQFNDCGNTTSVYNDQGQALYGRYATDQDSSARSNQLISSSRLQDTVINLLSDGSFESSGTSYSDAHSGSKSKSGTWSQSANVVSGEIYTLSGYIKGNGRLSIAVNGNTYSGEAVNSNSWTRSELTVLIPSGANSVTLGASSITGTAYFDDFQFEKAAAASRYNMLYNTDMGSLTNWTGSNGAVENVSGSRGNLNTSALAIYGSAGSLRSYTQSISISNGSTGDNYSFGAWVKSNSVPLSNCLAPGYPKRSCGIKVGLYNGSTLVKEEYVAANEDCGQWQFISGSVQATAAYNTVKFSYVYDRNVNTTYFDGAQLFRERFSAIYEYDDDGNVTSIKDIDGSTTTYSYTDDDDVSSITLPSGESYSYTYDNSHHLLSGTTPGGVTTTNSYDSYGNLASTTVSGGSSGKVLRSDTTYTSDGNMTASVTGSDRKTVTYTNDTERSLVSSVEDPNGTVTSYTYDSNRRLLSSSSEGSSVTNTYADDKLNTLTHSNTANKSTTYTIEYGTADLTEGVSVGNRQLSANTYNEDTWTLAEQSYGNGDYWHYTYDSTDKITSRVNESGTAFSYAYGNEGTLASITKSDNGTTVSTERYYYDDAERLEREVELDAAGEITHDVVWDYNEINQNKHISGMTEKIGDKSFVYSYTYDDDNRPVGTIFGNVTSTNAYTGLSLLDGKTVKSGSTDVLTSEFAYGDVSGTDYTTARVTGYTTEYAGQTHSIAYTYDDNGNITGVSAGGDSVIYTYDALNQLVWEYNEAAEKAWKYTYDLGGNILTKTEYDYDGANTSNPVTVTYTYGDSTWGDLLTSYGGQSITYDGIGNPTSYRGWTMAWEGGRQLNSMSKSGTSLSFKYNESGLRTKKTVGSTVHTYTYNNGKLAADVYGNEALYFHYDSLGDIIGFTYKNGVSETEYFYVKNVQGDVLNVINASGAVQASYTYDAWGNVLTSSGTLANINPIRYRGYYYDSETGFYYVSSRYYDPEVGRFISPDTTDVLTATPIGLTDKNLYAYCDNNPVIRVDHGGQFWETIFDVISLGASIVEVCVNPTDPWAWAGLAGDAIDLIPFVTGVGEVTRGIKTTVKVVDKADDVVGAAKVMYKTADKASDIRMATGSYEIIYKSGKNYVGKGGFNRAIKSAQRYGDDVATSIMWKSAPNAKQAFIDEFMMQTKRGVLSSNPFAETYNKIWSPGKRLFGR